MYAARRARWIDSNSRLDKGGVVVDAFGLFDGRLNQMDLVVDLAVLDADRVEPGVCVEHDRTAKDFSG